MRELNYEKVTEFIVEDIKAYFKNSGFSKAVIGMSGGIDSAVSYALTVRALGVENVMGLLLPNGINASADSSIKHAQEVINKFGGKHLIVDISNAVAVMCSWMGAGDNNIRRGNIAARTRMIALFDYANKEHCLVMGTENASEHWLGYFTLFGDSASCIEPIHYIYKTEIFQMAKYLGIPETIINKAPSADLWEGQTDEGELGFTYKDADDYMERTARLGGYHDEGSLTPTETAIEKRIEDTDFKRRIPYIVSDFSNCWPGKIVK